MNTFIDREICMKVKGVLDHNGIKLESNNKASGENLKYFPVKPEAWKQPWVKKEVTRDVRKYFELNGDENSISCFVGCS